jgi:hypothetical protein
MRNILLLIATFALAVAAQAVDRVLFFSPVMGKQSQQAKYAAIACAADGEDIVVDFRFTDEVGPEAAGAVFRGYRAVIFDAIASPEMPLAAVAGEYGPAVAGNPGLIAVALLLILATTVSGALRQSARLPVFRSSTPHRSHA